VKITSDQENGFTFLIFFFEKKGFKLNEKGFLFKKTNKFNFIFFNPK